LIFIRFKDSLSIEEQREIEKVQRLGLSFVVGMVFLVIPQPLSATYAPMPQTDPLPTVQYLEGRKVS